MKFYQQHAIITGGSSGIGKATALLLASEGAHISLIARTQTKLEAAKAEIEAARSHQEQRVVATAADLVDQVQVKRAIDAAIDQVGSPDLLITSGSIAHPGYFQKIPIKVFERTMAINYFGRPC